MHINVGKTVQRIDAVEKAAGTVQYLADSSFPGILHAKLVTSTHAHAKIKSIDTTEAWKVPGVRAIVTGEVFPYHIGPILADRPPLAFEKVRYHGEPLAIIDADQEFQAKQAAFKVRVEYEPLPVVNSVQQAFQKDSPLVHENSGQYQKIISNVYPIQGTNIGSHIKIRKGDFITAWENCDVKITKHFSFNLSDHAAIETRSAKVEINPAGKVIVHSTTQSPYTIKKVLNQFFNVAVGNIIVHAPLVGGAFGGKGTVQLEPLAYLASKSVGGKLVKLDYEREEDMITAPCHIGFDATVKLGATNDGKLVAGHYTYLIDSGAYTDQAAGITRAAALDCTGPYHIPNVWCDSYCMYTNHPYGTSFRGYGHPELTFAVERTMDMLAKQLNMCPIQLRKMNAIKPGHTSPTQAVITANNIGDSEKCLERAKELIEWDKGRRIEMDSGKILSKGISLFWKTSTTATNAQSGAVITFEADGSVNLNCAAIELGQGTKTVLAQILAEKLGMEINQIHVTMEINTQYDPHQWRTVASSTTFLAGRAVMSAADDAIAQLKKTASIAMQCSIEDLEVGGGRVYLKAHPEYGVNIKDIALGYKYPNGHAVEGQVIGTGKHIQRRLTPMDKETGFGKPGPWWSVGAQAVEVEWDPKDYTYKLLKAVTVLDGGTIINPGTATQQMRGGMYLGLSFASSEGFIFNENGIVQNPQLRNYQMLRFGEQPTEYLVDFIETPSADGPYGARGIGEYGVIGMAGALANSLSAAAEVELNQLPLHPEYIWKAKKENAT
ncbi:xanthine dehydrogenase family protein molybdopterin-binding subunit [Lederbergia wuyishanensis]|uniref:CO/xanthine dehydrogenase Mo-binding subunit n=1 Tax=Lederbergia wuyishanensis TaxID=1347903 RepID=A0ABU0DA88_9BACI|nr:xanthine dehydrogenase family protein molybdopterin-binding subunit [Lederbergia wuyishanensis]MCJ8010109.1 xanthine dehydrogenase family protein molybdopterin-binding subunit [Lederbergia wuyishanensis]MDQ0345347.1 CO/xanthine dehydrogenase Mo-binding subunit [Lederbergia wuyishanensis]